MSGATYHGAPLPPDICADISGSYNFCYFTNNPNVSVGQAAITINTKTGVGIANNVPIQSVSFNTFKWNIEPGKIGTFWASGSKAGKKKLDWGNAVWEQR